MVTLQGKTIRFMYLCPGGGTYPQRMEVMKATSTFVQGRMLAPSKRRFMSARFDKMPLGYEVE